jgi:hypothetical protein
MKITKAVAQSYARHLATSVALAVIVVANLVHKGPFNFTLGDWELVANALWLSALPQIRHYVQLKDPTLAPVVDYVASQVAASVPATPVVAPAVEVPTA